MSGLVEKVKGVVHNRAKHRANESADSASLTAVSDQQAHTPETPNRRNSMQAGEGGRGPELQAQNGPQVSTNSFAAMSLNDSHAAVSSAPSALKILPPLPTNAAQTVGSARGQDQALNGQTQSEKMLAGHGTTPRTPTHQRNISGSMAASSHQEIPAEVIPDRDSSLRRKPVPPAKPDTVPQSLDNMAKDRDILNHPKGPRALPAHRINRSIDVAPNDPSPLVPHFTTRSVVRDSGATGETQNRDLHLPANFDLRDTERTQVDTRFAPAVTHEEVHIQRTESITKVIHRDIHVDHYYTYFQPIRVVEVLPARHFRLNPETGVKTEIPAPLGYKLPAHLEPREAEDYSHLKQTTRHYVVDEDHPNGQLENPPWEHEHDISKMQGHQAD